MDPAEQIPQEAEGQGLDDIQLPDGAEPGDNEEGEELDPVQVASELNENLDAVGDGLAAIHTQINFWTTVAIKWSRSGGDSIRALQTAIRDTDDQFNEERMGLQAGPGAFTDESAGTPAEAVEPPAEGDPG